MGLKQPGRKVKSVQTALEIVEHLQEHDGATLTELCDRFDFARSTAHSYMSTLESMEYVTKQNGTYRVGLKFLSHGIAAKNSVSVSTLADSVLEDLATDTDTVAWLIVEEHGRAVFLDKMMSEEAVRTYGRVSKRTHLHTVAGGKVILAFMSEDVRQRILDNYGLPAETEHTITDIDVLEDDLASIRDRGYAISQHEAALGVSSVAAPIIHGGDVLGAIQVSSLASRLDEEALQNQLPDATIEAAEEVVRLYDELSE